MIVGANHGGMPDSETKTWESGRNANDPITRSPVSVVQSNALYDLTDDGAFTQPSKGDETACTLHEMT